MVRFLPYFIIAAILIGAGSYSVGSYNGHKAERKTWELAIAKQKNEAAQVLVGALRRVVETERKLAQINSDLEKSHAAKKDEINIAIAAALGRVRTDPGGVCRGNTSAENNVTNVPTNTTGGCELSERAGNDLTKLAGRADLVADYARQCYAWAKNLVAEQAP